MGSPWWMLSMGEAASEVYNGHSGDPGGRSFCFCLFVCWGGGHGGGQEENRKGLRCKGQNSIKKRIQFLVEEKTKAQLGR